MSRPIDHPDTVLSTVPCRIREYWPRRQIYLPMLPWLDPVVFGLDCCGNEIVPCDAGVGYVVPTDPVR